jgi:hypothetical protein
VRSVNNVLRAVDDHAVAPLSPSCPRM